MKVFWHPSSYFSERWQMIADASDYMIAEVPRARRTSRSGLANILGLKSIALDALGPPSGRAGDRPAGAAARPRAASGRSVGLACSSPVLEPEQVMRVLQARGRGI